MKYYKFLLIVFTIALFNACANFVDVEQEDTLPKEDIDLSDPAYIDGLVSSAYYDANLYFSSWVAQGIYLMRGDDYMRGGRDGDQLDFDAMDSYNYETFSTYWGNAATWNNLFNIVNTANTNIRTINQVVELNSGDATVEENAAESIAEVKFLRDYAYFMMINLWDGVPLIDENMDPKLYTARTTRDGILEFIIDDMDKCIPYLLDARPNSRTDARIGGITRYSALALKAKAALYLKDYQTVLDATSIIVNEGGFSLYPDYYNLFKPVAKLCDESLFELQFGAFSEATEDIVKSDNWFTFQGPSNVKYTIDTNGDTILSSVSIPVITGWGFITQEPEYISFMESRGETDRLEGTVLGQGYTRDGDEIVSRTDFGFPATYNYKAYTPLNQTPDGRVGYGDGNNIRMLRYADVLLMQAEAKIMLGQSGDSEINTVRTRANMPAISGADIDVLLDERLAELAGEWGFRFWDLVRNDKAEAVLGAKGFVKGESEYYPIAQDVVDQNPLLLESAIEYDPSQYFD